MSNVEETLKDRGSRYGPFKTESEMVCGIVDILFATLHERELPPVCIHAASMIVLKLVRAFNGDPCYADNWHDMAGYATLVEQWLNLKPAPEMFESDTFVETMHVPAQKKGPRM